MMDEIISTVTQPVSIIVWILLVGILVVFLRMWGDKAAQVITARMFLRYKTLRLGICIAAIGAASEVVAYSLAIVTDSLGDPSVLVNDPYVLLAFIIEAVVYFIGIIIMVSTLLPRHWRLRRNINKDTGGI